MNYKTQSGIVIGNVDAKYTTRNPVARALMNGFFSSFDDLVRRTGASEAHEIGCGEGYLSMRLARMGLNVRGSDFSDAIITEAKALNPSPRIIYAPRNIYDLDPEIDGAQLMVCCEVLEHLEAPEIALRKLRSVTNGHCILSVPREPVWRALNMARGKYMTDYGNTPGHIQHWGKTDFIRMISCHFDVIEVRSPLPWTMLLCRPKAAREERRRL